MKRYFVPVFGIILLFAACLPAAAFFDQGGPCNYLYIWTNQSSWRIDSSTVSCTHGKIRKQGNVFGIQIGCVDEGFYGPDCRISFFHKDDKARKATYNFQQNYCMYGAGDIHVEYISGETFRYTRHEGSYSDDKPGEVKITD